MYRSYTLSLRRLANARGAFRAAAALVVGVALTAETAAAQTAPGAPPGSPSINYNPYCINGYFPNGKKCSAYGAAPEKKIIYGFGGGSRRGKKGSLFKGVNFNKGSKGRTGGGWKKSSRGGKRSRRHY